MHHGRGPENNKAITLLVIGAENFFNVKVHVKKSNLVKKGKLRKKKKMKHVWAFMPC